MAPKGNVRTVQNEEIDSKEFPPPVNTKIYKWEIMWINVFFIVYVHLGGIYGGYLMIAEADWKTVVFNISYGFFSALGITAGAHRLWTHGAFKANKPLQILLAIMQASGFQNSIFVWVRDHRAHHKYTDTDADPHNATRGFIFSHVGWLMVRKQPEFYAKVKSGIDMSDLRTDPLVMFQHRNFLLLGFFFTFFLPTMVPYLLFGESLSIAWHCSLWKYMTTLNATWFVSSAAHIWGTKPYDKNVSATENVFSATVTLGDGWHNYHHIFPVDYKNAELGTFSRNPTAIFIEFFAYLGWATDLKTVSSETIRKRALRTGDGSHSPALKDVNHILTDNNSNRHAVLINNK